MDFIQHVGLPPGKTSIDWDLLPAETFAIFESWGGKIRVRNKSERYYYFFIDAGTKPARLSFMERGIKHARIVARIDAPRDLIAECMAEQGKTINLEVHYAINGRIRNWLEENILSDGNLSRVSVVADVDPDRMTTAGLPAFEQTLATQAKSRNLRSEGQRFDMNGMLSRIKKERIFDSLNNPEGISTVSLADTGDNLTVVDRSTNLMWMRGGCDINSIKTMDRWLAAMNESKFAGHDGWRLPTVEEALSLLYKEKTANGLHLDLCFSRKQPFILTADLRQPGDHWLVDFDQATAFWGSGFNPGGFGRACRSIKTP